MSAAPTPIPLPHPSRLDPKRADYAEIIEAHERAVREHRASYLDPRSSLSVLTVSTLQERGTCCDSGCRHCPYLEN